MKIRRRTKRPFLLLEVMVSILLLSLFAIPLTQTPIHFFKLEIKDLYTLELERVAETTYAEIRENLFKKHSQESFGTTIEEAKIFFLNNQELVIDGIATYSSKRSYKLWAQGDKEGKDGMLYQILKCRIYLSSPQKKDHSYDYHLLIKQNNKS